MASKKAAGKSTALVRWDEKFAKYARESREQVKNIGTGGVSVSFRPGAMFMGEVQLKENRLECVILGFTALNRWNEVAYDANNKQPPDCYAFSLMVDDPDMAPHPAATKKQADRCGECDKNVFGSANTGKGKACANTIRMGLIIGKDAQEPEEIAAADLVNASVSPTNLTHFKKYQDAVLEEMGRPLWAVVTEIRSQPDPKTQIRLEFKMVSAIEDDDILTALERRVEKVQEALQRPFPAPTAAPVATAVKAGKTQKFAAKKAVAGRR